MIFFFASNSFYLSKSLTETESYRMLSFKSAVKFAA